MKKISFLNYKGGVGKTTTLLNIAKGLVNQNKKVLLIDLDGQCNSTNHLIDNDYKISLPDLLLNNEKTNEAIINTKSGIDIIPCSISMESVLNMIQVNPTIRNDVLLNGIIKKINNHYDYILFDCPPQLNYFTVNVILISDKLVVPVEADQMSIDGFNNTIKFINQTSDNYEIAIDYILLSNKVNRNKIDNKFNNDMRDSAFNQFNQTIRYQAKPIREASLEKQFVIDKNEPISNDFKELVNEFIKIV